LEFENESKDIKFQLEDLRVGTELEIKGDFDDETNELKAKKIKIDLDQFKNLKQTAILSRMPEGIEKTEQGWSGLFFADGRRIKIQPTTHVLFKLNKSEKKEVEKRDKAKKNKNAKDEDADEPDDSDYKPLQSLNEIGPGVVMNYEGKVDNDGTILAARVEFMRNELEKGEASLWKSLKIKEKPADYQSFKPGELSIDKVGKFKLVPSQEAQEYVSRIGRSLIPSYQRELPDTDPLKIQFRFYLVVNKVPNAFALPNGVVVIHSAMFDILENEAQLASVIGHEIGHSVQEHSWRQMQYHRKKRMAMAIGGIAASAFGAYGIANMLQLIELAIRNGYQRSLENQSDRMGLEYMAAAGYDPREAPRVWKQMAMKHGDMPTNFFYSSHDNHATRRSYLMLEIRNNYSSLNYANLRTNEEAFKQVAMLTKESANLKKKIKVK
jgi:Zn-dependent protease with chaperone function